MNKGTLSLLVSLVMTSTALAQNADAASAAAHSHIKSVTAITEVFGEGQKTSAAAIEYDTDIDTAKLSPTAFTVADRTITKVYANTKADKSAHGINGRFIILELSPSDAGSATFSQNMPLTGGRGPGGPGQGPGGPGTQGPGPGGPPNGPGGPGGPGGPTAGGPPRNMSNGAKRTPAKVTVIQAGEITTVKGQKYPADEVPVTNSKTVNLVVDDFVQRNFTDSKTGESFPYNLFVPKNYDKSKSYPLIIFIHDAGVLSNQADTTLLQGLGAIIWATPAEQAKHPAFVLAPQFNRTPGSGSLTDVTVDLIQSVAAEYSVDRKRIYTTGQSLGCTLSMEMMLKYPDLFAAAMLVAGQIEDTPRTAGLANQKFWMTVSEGDFIAFPTMNKSLPIMEAAGAKIARGRWSARLAGPELAARDKEMLAQGTNILYTTFERGTTFPPGLENSTGTEHMGTWRFAYLNEGIRDWLFSQTK
jgi:predicted peptidase